MRFRITLLLGAALSLSSPNLRATAPAAPSTGWWRDATFYEIFVRSFADAHSGPLAGDGIGDLQGVIEHLDYLNDGRGPQSPSLGVNALWLMPIHPSPSYHGYDVTDYFSVNPQYGDLALMKRLVAEAHQRGIRVIIDLVLNHCSSAHPLFVRARDGQGAAAEAARRSFRFAELPEQLAGPWGQWVWHPAGASFYYGAFTHDMPDWNFREPSVTEHHRRVAAFWLREVGVDGFRLDAVRYFHETDHALQDTEETRQWLREFTAYCHEVKPSAFVVGENTADMREVARMVRGGSLDSAFEFDLAKAAVQAVRLQTPGILMRALRDLHGLYGDNAVWATILTNHDQERAMTQLGGSATRARLATSLLLTLPGVPFIYYAEELGARGAKPDPELRTPMAWTPELPNGGFTSPGVSPWHALTFDVPRENVATQDADPQSFLSLYRRLIRLNAASPAIRSGRPVEIVRSDRSLYCVMRQTDHEAVLLLGNFSPAARPGPALSIPAGTVRPDWTASEALHAAPLSAPTVDAQGAVKDWVPLPALAPEQLYVIRLRSANTP